MLLLTTLLGAVLAATAAAQGEPARYDGHKVVRAAIADDHDLQAMLRLSDDVWSEHIGVGPADFRVRPEAMATLAAAGVPYEVLVEDVQSLIDAERARLANPARTAGWFDDYKDLDAIHAHMDALAALRPDLAEGFDVGTSIEGRPIKGLRITSGGAGPGRRKAGMVFAATQHAREWIAPMVTMYLAEALVTRYDADPAIRSAVDRVEFFIVPVVNPDGYAYTWTTDRLWRKNRRDIDGSSCFGIDLNRNWGFQWGLPQGSSGDPCNHLYRGTAPFSEPETVALRDFIVARPWVRYVHDMHSYGQLLLHPWGYTNVQPSGDYGVLGAAMAQLIRGVHGRTYVHGPAYTTLYPISGGASDWAWGAEQAYSFTFELRGSGFILPPDQIVPNAEEILPAALHLADWIVAPR